MKILKKLFKAKRKSPPQSGELWILKDDSPWPSKYKPVKVLNCKKGWVRYDMPPLFMDQRERE